MGNVLVVLTVIPAVGVGDGRGVDALGIALGVGTDADDTLGVLPTLGVKLTLGTVSEAVGVELGNLVGPPGSGINEPQLNLVRTASTRSLPGGTKPITEQIPSLTSARRSVRSCSCCC